MKNYLYLEKRLKGVIKIGLFDTIEVYMKCPYCERPAILEAQTKDLDKSLHHYRTLRDDWFKDKIFGKPFRKKLPVFRKFPMDKSATVWKNQAERREAAASIPDTYKKLKYVNVIASCHSTKCKAWADKRDMRIQGCTSGFGRMFEGKIKIKKGMLFGDIYDIELIEKRLPRKNRQKVPRKQKTSK